MFLIKSQLVNNKSVKTKFEQENKEKYDKLKKMSFVASPFLREAGMIIEDKE